MKSIFQVIYLADNFTAEFLDRPWSRLKEGGYRLVTRKRKEIPRACKGDINLENLEGSATETMHVFFPKACFTPPVSVMFKRVMFLILGREYGQSEALSMFESVGWALTTFSSLCLPTGKVIRFCDFFPSSFPPLGPPFLPHFLLSSYLSSSFFFFLSLSLPFVFLFGEENWLWVNICCQSSSILYVGCLHSIACWVMCKSSSRIQTHKPWAIEADHTNSTTTSLGLPPSLSHFVYFCLFFSSWFINTEWWPDGQVVDSTQQMHIWMPPYRVIYSRCWKFMEGRHQLRNVYFSEYFLSKMFNFLFPSV